MATDTCRALGRRDRRRHANVGRRLTLGLFGLTMLAVGALLVSQTRLPAQEPSTHELTPQNLRRVAFPGPSSCCSKCRTCRRWRCDHCGVSCDCVVDGQSLVPMPDPGIDEPDAADDFQLAQDFQGATPARYQSPRMIGDFFGPTTCSSTVLGPVVDTADLTSILTGESPEYFTYADGSGVMLPPDFDPIGFTDGLTKFGSGVVSDGEFSSDFTAGEYAIRQVYRVCIPSPSAGGVVGRVRLSDNNSAMPVDRVFFDYNHFQGVPLVSSGLDVNRFTVGLEKTFNMPVSGALSSVEVRLPMAMTLSSSTISDGPSDMSRAEFGNMAITLKSVFYQSEMLTAAVGLGISVPTADNVEVGLADGTALVLIENRVVHLIPYLAFLYTPDDTFFAHVFVQADLANGSNPSAAT